MSDQRPESSSELREISRNRIQALERQLINMTELAEYQKQQLALYINGGDPMDADQFFKQLEQLASLQERECWCVGFSKKQGFKEVVYCEKCNGTGKLPATHMIVPVKATVDQVDAGYNYLDATAGSVEPQVIYKIMIKAAQEKSDD